MDVADSQYASSCQSLGITSGRPRHNLWELGNPPPGRVRKQGWIVQWPWTPPTPGCLPLCLPEVPRGLAASSVPSGIPALRMPCEEARPGYGEMRCHLEGSWCTIGGRGADGGEPAGPRRASSNFQTCKWGLLAPFSHVGPPAEHSTGSEPRRGQQRTTQLIHGVVRNNKCLLFDAIKFGDGFYSVTDN